jgi:hypothetical protein
LEVVVTRGVVLKKIVPGLKHKISNSNILQWRLGPLLLGHT